MMKISNSYATFFLKFITKSPNNIKQALIQQLVQTDKKETSETMMA